MSIRVDVKTLSIDGQQVSGRAGQTILEVAREHSIDIPTLCHLDGLRDVGACRLCLVSRDLFANPFLLRRNSKNADDQAGSSLGCPAVCGWDGIPDFTVHAVQELRLRKWLRYRTHQILSQRHGCADDTAIHSSHNAQTGYVLACEIEIANRCPGSEFANRIACGR
jgi:ferredoxin